MIGGVYLLDGEWKDDVGGKVYGRANSVIASVNSAADKMETALKRVESMQRKSFEYTPRTPELLEIKARIEQSLGI